MSETTYRTTTLFNMCAVCAGLSAMNLVVIALFLQIPRPAIPLSLSGALGISFLSLFASVSAMQSLARAAEDRVTAPRTALMAPSVLCTAYLFLVIFAINRLLGLHSWF